MATPFNPLKIPIVYLNSPTPQKISQYFNRTEIFTILAYCCLNLVAMAPLLR